MKRVTIQDIANRLQLSRNTVAKALSGQNVSEWTRMAVLRTAQDMGYSKLTDANLAALAAGCREENRQRAILVLSGRSKERFWTEIVAGIGAELNRRGYRMQLHIVDERDADSSMSMEQIVPDVEGLIFLTVFEGQFVEGMARARLPMTFFDAPPSFYEFLDYGDVVYPEGWFSTKRLVQHFIKAGCRNFGYMGYPQGTKSIHDRYDGYLSALRESGLRPDGRFQFTQKVDGDYYDYGVVERLIGELDEYPDVFVCANDAVARCIASALLKKNLPAGEQPVLAGFDHVIEPEFFRQDIYTVDVNKEDIGRQLVRSVLGQIRDRTEHALIAVRTRPLIPDERE